MQWVRPIAGDGSEAIKRLAVDANGTIFALGAFQQTLDLGAGPLTSAGAMDLLVAAFDATGHHLWSSRAGNPWNEVAGGIALDRAGNVVITGSFDRDADLWGTKLVAAGESDRPERALGIAMSLTWLAFVLHVAAVVLRGLSVHRAPWGNMFEFATTGAVVVTAVFLAVLRRHDVSYLGGFVIGPVLLTLGLAVTVFYTETAQLVPALRSVWLLIHVSVAFIRILLLP